jgi:flagellar biosynthesis chaperone FliJ
MDPMEFVFGIVFIGIISSSVLKMARMKYGSKQMTALEAEVDDLRAQLTDAENVVNSHAQQLEEIQQRLDFAERVLAQGRQKQALEPGSPS